MNQAKPRRGALRRWLDEPGVFLKWVAFACVIGIVVGGGNFWRGRSSGRMERTAPG